MRTTAPVSIVRNGHTYVRLPAMAGYDELLIDQRIQYGEPCIRGTRIPASTIAAMYTGTSSDVAQICSMYEGYVTKKQIQACIDYVNEPFHGNRPA